MTSPLVKPGASMTDSLVGVLTIVVCAGALLPTGGSRLVLLVPAGCMALAWFKQWPVAFIVGAAVLASLGAGAAWADLGEVAATEFVGDVVLLSDPEAAPGGIRVRASIDGASYDLRAWGSPAGHLRNRLMGERVDLEANLRPLGDAPDWLRAQGITGRGTVTSVSSFDVGAIHTRLANSLRRTIESGAASLSRDERSLFAGLVYGDDRDQSALTADNFDAAGLTHLLAVSGQNVAFVLAIAGPVLRRLGHRWRFGFVLGVLVFFATVTRFEASVVRASVMAAVAATGALIGAEVSSRRILAIAVSGLILVDPLIVHSVAFQLSVAASAGILFWSGRVARALPGPRPLIESLAVTSTAQLAVAPLLVWRFDGLPVASLPSNLLAGPAAGPVMMWGLTAGSIAGLVPDWLATVLHWPTQAALWWIDSVAALAPRLQLGLLSGPHIVLLFIAGWLGLRSTSRQGRVASATLLLVVLLHPAIALAGVAPHTRSIDTDSVIWRDDATTLVEVDSRSRPQHVLATLRSAGIGHIDVLVLRQASFANASLATMLRSRHDVAAVWAPSLTLGVGEQIPEPGTSLVVDGVHLTVSLEDGRLRLIPQLVE